MIEENNNTLPLVTIGVLSYNNARFIIETLDSIKAQTYSNIELIIVDDCSKDNSVVLITEWLNEHRYPAEFIVNEKNLGICKSLNIILSKANGKYFVPFSSDDIMMAGRIENEVNTFEGQGDEVGAIYSDAYVINELSEPFYGWFIQKYRQFETLPTGDIFNDLVVRNFIPAVAIMIRRSVFFLIGNYDESLPYEDYDMHLRIAKSYKFINHSFVTVKYRVHSKSLSKNFIDWEKIHFNIYKKHIEKDAVRKKMLSILYRSYENKKKCSKEMAIWLEKNIEAKNFVIKFIKLGFPFETFLFFTRFKNFFLKQSL